VNGVLRTIFGLRREEGTGVENCVTTTCVMRIPNIIRVIKENGMGGACGTRGGEENWI
jgi:hypothetical protein